MIDLPYSLILSLGILIANLTPYDLPRGSFLAEYIHLIRFGEIGFFDNYPKAFLSYQHFKSLLNFLDLVNEYANQRVSNVIL